MIPSNWKALCLPDTISVIPVSWSLGVLVRIILGMSGLTVWSINKRKPYPDTDLLGVVPAEHRAGRAVLPKFQDFPASGIPTPRWMHKAQGGMRGVALGWSRSGFPAVPACALHELFPSSINPQFLTFSSLSRAGYGNGIGESCPVPCALHSDKCTR